MVRERCMESLFEISNDDIERIKKDIGEDEQRLRHIEDLVSQWIQCEPHLPKNYDRNMARNFIRGSKFNLDTVKRKLEGYFLAKYEFPEVYHDRNPKSKQILQAFESTNIVRLPRLTENGERVCILSLASPDAEIFDLAGTLKAFWMLYDLTLTCKFPIISEILIFDCTNFTSNHMVKFLGTQFKNSISIFRDAYAARVSQVHLVNCPPMVDKVASAVRPLIHEKVRERFMIHRGSESLLQHVPPKTLPAEFGGTLGSLSSFKQQWQEILIENSQWFKQQEAVKIIGKPPKRIHRFANDVGLEGSFRQLNID